MHNGHTFDLFHYEARQNVKEKGRRLLSKTSVQKTDVQLPLLNHGLLRLSSPAKERPFHKVRLDEQHAYLHPSNRNCINSGVDVHKHQQVDGWIDGRQGHLEFESVTDKRL